MRSRLDRVSPRTVPDGRSLAGWEPAGGTSGYAVRHGQIVLLTEGEDGLQGSEVGDELTQVFTACPQTLN